jgi:hypothetical protein
MMRIAGLLSAVSVFAMDTATADEIRRTVFAGTLVGTWAQSADFCAKADKSNFAIAPSSYTGPDGSCNVDIIVETAGSKGTNYSVRGKCTATPQDQPHVVNVIMRQAGTDDLAIGASFEDLKPYQRCPAKP